ncbi:MAG: choice-of-anchor Q domain-containing protein, partial [Chthoniobacterales bacterium]
PNILNNVGTVVSQGYNLSNDAAGGDGSTGPGGFLNATGDIRNTDPLLGPLANNGGPTLTHAFPINSPVLDKGKNFGLPFDQRGLLRTADSPVFANATGGDGTDIGAVEFYPLGGVDTDGDGMSDDFETFYGVSDPNGDPDGDGLTNLQEFQAGTNPLDPTSGLRIIAVARNGNDFMVTFSLAVAGKSYRLERKDALTDAFWSSISGVADLTAVSTGSAQLTDTDGAAVTKHFYHVRVLP